MSAADYIDNWLYEKPTIMWGRGFNIEDPASRAKAAVWFQEQVESFYTFNSGIPLQIKDPDIDVAHLIAENKAAALEIERLRMELAARPLCP